MPVEFPMPGGDRTAGDSTRIEPRARFGIHSSGRARLPLLLFAVLLAVAVYSPTLTYERTLDDVTHIRGPGEGGSASFRQVWSEPYWERRWGAGLYRPITSTTYWLEHRGEWPLGIRHLVNVVLHAAVTALVMMLAAGLGLPPVASAVSGILFALHPVHVEVVAGLVGRAELLAALWTLIALLLHDRSLRAFHTRTTSKEAILGLTSAGLLAFLAAGSKESAWLLPAFALALHGARRRAVGRAWPCFVGYLAGIGTHLVLRRVVLDGWLNLPEYRVGPFENPLIQLHGLERFLGGLRVLGVYLSHLVFPARLSPDYTGGTIPLTGDLLDPRLLAAGLFLLGSVLVLVFGTLRPRPGRPVPYLGAAWLLVSALATLNLFLTLQTLVADRLLYWPSVAWCLLLGAAAGWVLRLLRSGSPRIRFAAAGCALMLLFGSVGYARGLLEYLPAWRNNASLFAYATKAAPRSPLNWTGLGRVRVGQGDLEGALDAYRRVQLMDPNYPSAWCLEAAALIDHGRFEEAKRPLTEARRLAPDEPVARFLEGILWLEDGRAEAAASRFREALAADPRDPGAQWHLALALRELGDVGETETAWRRYLELDPENAGALNNLAWLLATEAGKPIEAETLARRAVALDSTSANYRDTLAEALLRQGKREEAARVAAAAIPLAARSTTRPALERFLIPGAVDTAESGAGDVSPEPPPR